MSEQTHIIQRQVLEIQMPEKADVQALSEDLARMYRERLLPIINRLCDMHSREGTLCQIDQLNIDLGELQMDKIEEVFTQKFAEALATQEVSVLPSPGEELKEGEKASKPLALLSYYLQTGILPWWASGQGKKELQAHLDNLNVSGTQVYRELLREVGRNQVYRERFVQTFSEDRIVKSLSVLSPFSLAPVQSLEQKLSQYARLEGQSLSGNKVSAAYWAAVFAYLGHASSPSGLLPYVLGQCRLKLGPDFDSILHKVKEQEAVSNFLTRNRAKQGIQQQAAFLKKLQSLRSLYHKNPLFQSFFDQLGRVLKHPHFAGIGREQLRTLECLLAELEAARDELTSPNPSILRVTSQVHLTPLAQHLQALEQQLKKSEDRSDPQVMDRLKASFDDTDSITVQNAGLVIFWPFLSRFFEKSGLLEGKAFKDAAAQNKAVCLLQNLVEEGEEAAFEGDLPLNKILCGMDLSLPSTSELPDPTDLENIEGLLQAVIARGPHWKNLSIPGFRNSYLKREGLLRSRDGHWLLQVKKETFDITLERLPWSFHTVKLPWMNQILIVEWI